MLYYIHSSSGNLPNSVSSIIVLFFYIHILFCRSSLQFSFWLAMLLIGFECQKAQPSRLAVGWIRLGLWKSKENYLLCSNG